MKGLNCMNFSHDTTIKEYEISLSICRDIIKNIFDVDYKEYHNIGIKSYNKYYIECRDMYVYTSCFIMGVPETIISEIENINTYRYGKFHKSTNVIQWCLDNLPDIPDLGFTKPPLVMPEQYKYDDHILSYRQYYIHEKQKFCTWKNREIPDWFVENCVIQK